MKKRVSIGFLIGGPIGIGCGQIVLAIAPDIGIGLYLFYTMVLATIGNIIALVVLEAIVHAWKHTERAS